MRWNEHSLMFEEEKQERTQDQHRLCLFVHLFLR